MRASVTWTFSVLFLIVAALYVRLNPVDLKDLSIPGEASLRVLPLLHDGGVQWIQIQNAGSKEVVTLEKKKGSWQILFPVVYPADSLIVDGLATALKLSSKARRLLPERDWDEYGLLKPSLKIGVEAEPGKRRYLYLGDASPVGNFVYARWEGEKEYFLVQADLKKAFERSIYSLRQKQIFRVPLQDISKIHVRTLTADYEVVKKRGKWFWMEPIPILGKEVSKKQMDELFAAVSDLYVKEFLDSEKGDPEKSGFSLQAPFVQVRGKGKNVETLKIGREVEAQDAFYGMREDEKIFFLAARRNIRSLFEMIEAMAQPEAPPQSQTPNVT